MLQKAYCCCGKDLAKKREKGSLQALESGELIREKKMTMKETAKKNVLLAQKRKFFIKAAVGASFEAIFK